MLLNMHAAIKSLIGMGLRTFLAMLGILIGTGSVVAMVSSGEMATEQALSEFKALGTDMMSLSIASSEGGGKVKSRLTLEKALKIKSLTPDIRIFAPYMSVYNSNAFYKGAQLTNVAGVIAATQELQPAIRIKIQEGRFISNYDKYGAFCVIGQNLYKQLNKRHVVGQQLRVGDTIFTIIGVIAKWPQNSFFQQNVNDSVFVTTQNVKVFNQDLNINMIVMRLTETANIPRVEKVIKDYMATILPGQAVRFNSAEELIKGMNKQAHTLNLMLGFIGGISLFVGGVGVMNIMLVSVLERRREIGIRLALGAKRRQIQWMFLSEAVILSGFGGLLGVVFGIFASYIVAKTSNWQFYIFFTPAFAGFAVSTLTGVFFGYYPARRASQLDPIETLRAE